MCQTVHPAASVVDEGSNAVRALAAPNPAAAVSQHPRRRILQLSRKCALTMSGSASKHKNANHGACFMLNISRRPQKPGPPTPGCECGWWASWIPSSHRRRTEGRDVADRWRSILLHHTADCTATTAWTGWHQTLSCQRISHRLLR